MAAIVKKIDSGKRYVLLGAGYGAFRSERPGAVLGALAPAVNKGVVPMLCVCDESARISWLESSSAVVESIDGQDVRFLLAKQRSIPDMPESRAGD